MASAGLLRGSSASARRACRQIDLLRGESYCLVARQKTGKAAGGDTAAGASKKRSNHGVLVIQADPGLGSRRC